jgi:broad specificity phosphatase PhoE
MLGASSSMIMEEDANRMVDSVAALPLLSSARSNTPSTDVLVTSLDVTNMRSAVSTASSSSSVAAAATTKTTATTSAAESCAKPVIVWGIRHGQSLENIKLHDLNNGWGHPFYRDDVSLRDTLLSQLGQNQCRALCQQFDSSSSSSSSSSSETLPNLLEIDSIIISPLRRCLQTYVYALAPILDQLFSTTPAGDDSKDGYRKNGPTVIIQPLATERVYTVGDAGQHIYAEDIQQELRKLLTLDHSLSSSLSSSSYYFSPEQWDWSHVPHKVPGTLENDPMDSLPHPWWYTLTPENEASYQEWRPYGEGQWYAVPGEPCDIFAPRMSKLMDWIQSLSPSKNKMPTMENEKSVILLADTADQDADSNRSNHHQRQVILVAHWGVLGYLCTQAKYHDQIISMTDLEREAMMFDVPNCGVVRLG